MIPVLDHGWRVVADALMRHGEYDESRDSMDWLRADVDGALAAVPEGPFAVIDALVDAGWWEPEAAAAAVRICSTG